MVKSSMSVPPKASGNPCVAPSFVTASHEVLFEDVEATRCDVCAALIVADAEDASSPGYDVRGSGLLVWSRGEERRYQEPPLCAGCAAAIGVSALQRWEIEEEEG
jgi:hypothetical protein